MVRALDNSDEARQPITGLTYTPARATKTLPLVRRVVKDLLNLRVVMDQQQMQLDGFDQLGETINQAAYRDELADVEKTLTAEKEKWQLYINELAAIGVTHHIPFDGTIDFPAILNRRPIRLCWRPGDEAVEYWHEVDESSDDRKKIDLKMLPTLAS
jgi:hypothetical protein